MGKELSKNGGKDGEKGKGRRMEINGKEMNCDCKENVQNGEGIAPV